MSRVPRSASAALRSAISAKRAMAPALPGFTDLRVSTRSPACRIVLWRFRLSTPSANNFRRTSPPMPCAPATAARVTWSDKPIRPSRRPRPERPRRCPRPGSSVELALDWSPRRPGPLPRRRLQAQPRPRRPEPPRRQPLPQPEPRLGDRRFLSRRSFLGCSLGSLLGGRSFLGSGSFLDGRSLGLGGGLLDRLGGDLDGLLLRLGEPLPRPAPRRPRRRRPPCFARSSARSLAFSPGSPLFGLLRAGALPDAGGVEEAERRGRTAGRRPRASGGCGRRRASRAPRCPWGAADCSCRPAR